MKEYQQLPMAIKVAAKCEALDDCTVIPMQEYCFAYRPEVRVLKIGNWRERLAKKSVARLTDHIERTKAQTTKGNKPIFKPHALGNVELKGIWAYNEMIYDLIAT